jgi:hypothetical protein
MMPTDPATRDAFIAGLRELADFLAARPAVAVPGYGADITVQPSGSDEEEAAEIDAFAAAVGVDVLDERQTGDLRGYHVGRYSAVREFGPVIYRAFTYTSSTMAKFDAIRSYENNIQTADATPVELDEAA